MKLRQRFLVLVVVLIVFVYVCWVRAGALRKNYNDTSRRSSLPDLPEDAKSDRLLLSLHTLLALGQVDPFAIPVWCSPLMYDANELEAQLSRLDWPVRHFEFHWNSDDIGVAAFLARLRKLPFGVSVGHTPDNLGYGASMNRMMSHHPIARWFFLVNADAVFSAGALECFSKRAHESSGHGLVYGGPARSTYAFAVTRVALETVGYFDEVFYPAYMEDIDYLWRVSLSGLRDVSTGCDFGHETGGNNIRKSARYKLQIKRTWNGLAYGWMKWGTYPDTVNANIASEFPPSGYRTPFNIPNASLKLWVVDQGHRECVVTGNGLVETSDTVTVCWYNLNVLSRVLGASQVRQIPVRHLRRFGFYGF